MFWGPRSTKTGRGIEGFVGLWADQPGREHPYGHPASLAGNHPSKHQEMLHINRLVPVDVTRALVPDHGRQPEPEQIARRVAR